MIDLFPADTPPPAYVPPDQEGGDNQPMETNHNNGPNTNINLQGRLAFSAG